MHIIVCAKQVPDPERSRSCFVINPDENTVEPRGIPPVLNTFDESALEAALRIKDAHGGEVRVTILTLGHKISKNVMLKALAPGADDLLQIEDEAFAPGRVDSHATASVLAAAIEKAGDVDLILVGRQAADWNAGQVGIGLAHFLNVPVVTLARTIEIEADALLVERELLDGHESVRCSLPAVVMVSSDIGALRYSSLPQVRAAKKKPVVTWSARDIGLDTETMGNRIVLRRLYEPELRSRDCVMINGDSPEEAGRRLAERLREDSVLSVWRTNSSAPSIKKEEEYVPGSSCAL